MTCCSWAGRRRTRSSPHSRGSRGSSCWWWRTTRPGSEQAYHLVLGIIINNNSLLSSCIYKINIIYYLQKRTQFLLSYFIRTSGHSAPISSSASLCSVSFYSSIVHCYIELVIGAYCFLAITVKEESSVFNKTKIWNLSEQSLEVEIH